MSLFINIIFFAFTITILAIASFYCANSAVRVTRIPNYKDNKDLENAHKNLTIGSVIGWLTVSFIVIGGLIFILVAIFGAPEEAAGAEAVAAEGEESGTISKYADYFVYFLLGISLIAVGIVGILCAFAAGQINASGVPNKDLANRQAIIATVLAIVGFLLISITLIVRLFYKPKSKQNQDITKLEAQVDADGTSILDSQNLTDHINSGGNGGRYNWLLNEMNNDPQLSDALIGKLIDQSRGTKIRSKPLPVPPQ